MRRPASPLKTASDVTGDPRWMAVAARDRTADGRFVYAVRTTGVYCRPSCGARLPRPENVGFYDSGEGAAAAGFRPCKRCRPDRGSLAERNAIAVADACRAIEAAGSAPTLERLAADAGMSPFHFHRLFKAALGVTPRQYAAAKRGQRLRDEIAAADTVTRAIYDAGYNSSARFYAEAKEVLGMTPSNYRDGARDLSIRFAVGECSLGSILVAATDRGICTIALGAEPDELVRELQQRFPRAELVGGDGEFERTVAEVVGFVDSAAPELPLPLDLRGTAFQQRVWRALRDIPSGSTVSYAELARRVGAPSAARAVAQACAANPLAVAIPCHPVVRTDGSPSGYRWGVERKRALLEREARGAAR